MRNSALHFPGGMLSALHWNWVSRLGTKSGLFGASTPEIRPSRRHLQRDLQRKRRPPWVIVLLSGLRIYAVVEAGPLGREVPSSACLYMLPRQGCGIKFPL